MSLVAPISYFGGKSRAAPLVWAALGPVTSYVEPFCGSAAVLLARPLTHPRRWELINDLDRHVANFWRSVREDPECVIACASDPPSEVDLRARHRHLRDHWDGAVLETDPHWHDARAAGWWAWGMCCSVGSGWAWSSAAPVLNPKAAGIVGRSGAERVRDLQARLRRVRVMCGDWKRVLGPSYLYPSVVSGGGEPCGPTGVFLDPPYGGERGVSYGCDAAGVARDVEAWCFEHGQDPHLRIVLAGYEGDYELPGWRVVEWVAKGDYRKSNGDRERLWLSPGCLEAAEQPGLFGAA